MLPWKTSVAEIGLLPAAANASFVLNKSFRDSRKFWVSAGISLVPSGRLCVLLCYVLVNLTQILKTQTFPFALIQTHTSCFFSMHGTNPR